MISAELSRTLRDAGLRWHPATGDRFVIDKPGVDDDVYTVSEMTVERHDYPTGTILGFNGTTEWALDSVDADDALWLPREDQLRELLGRAFVALTRDTAPDDTPTWSVSAVLGNIADAATADADAATATTRTFTHPDAAEAYGRALAAYITAALA